MDLSTSVRRTGRTENLDTALDRILFRALTRNSDFRRARYIEEENRARRATLCQETRVRLTCGDRNSELTVRSIIFDDTYSSWMIKLNFPTPYIIGNDG